MVVASLVESARSEKLKKHLSIPEEDEYQCSSGPLNGKKSIFHIKNMSNIEMSRLYILLLVRFVCQDTCP